MCPHDKTIKAQRDCKRCCTEAKANWRAKRKAEGGKQVKKTKNKPATKCTHKPECAKRRCNLCGALQVKNWRAAQRPPAPTTAVHEPSSTKVAPAPPQNGAVSSERVSDIFLEGYGVQLTTKQALRISVGKERLSVGEGRGCGFGFDTSDADVPVLLSKLNLRGFHKYSGIWDCWTDVNENLGADVPTGFGWTIIQFYTAPTTMWADADVFPSNDDKHRVDSLIGVGTDGFHRLPERSIMNVITIPPPGSHDLTLVFGLNWASDFCAILVPRNWHRTGPDYRRDVWDTLVNDERGVIIPVPPDKSADRAWYVAFKDTSSKSKFLHEKDTTGEEHNGECDDQYVSDDDDDGGLNSPY